MPKEPHSLEKRVRDKAWREYLDSVTRAKNALQHAIGHRLRDVTIDPDEIEGMNAAELFDLIITKMVKHHKVRVGDDAVVDYMNRIEQLAADVEDLYLNLEE